MDLALIVLRVVVGAFFVGHGAQKLFGWFGGHGPAGTAGFFESLGIRPGHVHARAAGWAEFGGGLLLVLGLLTPLAAAAIIATMLVAIITVHWKNGPWSTDGGYEYNAVVLALLFALTDEDSGTGWALAALAAGAASSWLVTGPLNEPASGGAPDQGPSPDAQPAGDPASMA